VTSVTQYSKLGANLILSTGHFSKYGEIELFFMCEGDSRLRYNATLCRWSRPTFQRCVLPPSSARWMANITLMMEAVCPSETSGYSNDTTRPYIPEGSHLHTRRRENLKSHILFMYLLKKQYLAHTDKGRVYDNLLGYSAMYSRSRPTFQRFMLPPSSGW
jgi:hypothetical protein